MNIFDVSQFLILFGSKSASAPLGKRALVDFKANLSLHTARVDIVVVKLRIFVSL